MNSSPGKLRDDITILQPAKTISLTYTFDDPYVYNAGFDRVEMEGLSLLDRPGEPVLPFYTAMVLIPPKAVVMSVDITPGDRQVVQGSYKLEPAGEPVPLSELTEADMSPELLEPSAAVYGSGQPYPGAYSELVVTQRFRGYDIAVVNIFPVQYIPAKGEIYYFNRLTLNLKYEEAGRGSLLESNYREFAPDMDAVTDIIDNPEMIPAYGSHYSTDEQQPFTSLTRDLNESAKWDMVIITNDELNESAGMNYTFQDLVDYRNANGVKTTIVTVENIISEPAYWNTTNSKFNDTAAQIRNFIIYAYNNWGITYVLLGGDGDGKDVGGESGDEIIPARGLYCAGDHIPADLYYAGLDGDWNNDGDDNWGEYPTESDLMAEIYIGRAPVDSPKEVENFVRKTLHYETTNSSYLDDALMAGEFLWANPDTYGGDYMDELVEGSDNWGYSNVGIPHDIYYPEDYTISYIYDRDWANNKWPKSEMIKLINEEPHMIHHLGHSNTLYTFKMSVTDVAKLNNTEYFFGYSQGCYPGAFDNRGTSSTQYYTSDSIVEHFIVDEYGAFAFVANSRYGYGIRGSTNGASQRFHRQFVDALYGEDMRDLGRANADSKHDNIGYASSSVNLWCLYESNLFGDPSTFLRGPKPADHDISVPVMTAPDHVAPNTKIFVNTTVLNKGFCPEDNIIVNFTVDGGLAGNYTIPSLSVGQSMNLSFNWTPVMGIYDIAVEARPSAPDEFLQNNRREKKVIVEPDIAVTTATFEPTIYLKEQTGISATVANIGKTAVNNIKVFLFENSVERYNQTITSLGGGAYENVSLVWTPQTAGMREISIFAQNNSDEHSVWDNYYNKTVTVWVHPEIDHSPISFELTVEQAAEKTLDLTLYNNGTSELVYEFSDYSTKGRHRKIALISDRIELLNITDTLKELDLEYTVYNNNTWNKYTEDYNILSQYGLIIFYTASREISLNEKLAFDKYLTGHGGNLIVTGYDSLGSPTDYNLAYVVRSQYAYDGPWYFECEVTDAAHPIISGPFGKLSGTATFDAADFDHDRAVADPDRGSKSIVTVDGYAKILVTDSVENTGAKIAYWNGNQFTQDWDLEGSTCEMLLKNLLVWAADDGRYDWLSEVPQAGSLDFENNKVISLTINTSGLYAGNYYRNIVIASNDTDEPSVLIPVKLTVPTPVHDIAVRDFSSVPVLPIAENAYFNATLQNEGTASESGITIALQLDGVPVDTCSVTSLPVSGTSAISFQYAANSSVSAGEHEISIYAQPVSGENGTFNNIDTLTINFISVARLELTPSEPSISGNFRNVESTALELRNNGSELLTAHFGTYNYILEDKFKSTTLDSSIWSGQSGTPAIVSWGLNEPSSSYSLNLDSTSDIVESISINLANATSAEIGFYVELGGAGYRPRSSAWLYLDYYAANSTWQTLWERQGYGTYVGYRLGNITYDFYVVRLPDDAFHSNFKFRFRTYGLNNGYDDWLIDDVRFESIGMDGWLITNRTTASVGPFGGFDKLDLVANLTSLSLGVYKRSLYVHSNDAASRFSEFPVTVTVLGDLDHIHMSQPSWLGTADEILKLSAWGHDINHREVKFDEYWYTTDPNGTINAGVYDPGKTGSWEIYCNNSDNSISNYTTVSISTGNLAYITISPDGWSGTADGLVTFTAKGYDDDDNEMAFGAVWTITDPKGTITQTGEYRAGCVGEWIVRCTNATTGINETVSVSVTDPCQTDRIMVSPDTITMTTDDEQLFTAVIYDKYDNIINAGPSWSISGGANISPTGLFAPDTIGVFTVFASYDGKYGSAVATVNAGVLASLEITPADVTLTAGHNQQFTVKGFDGDGNVRPAVIQWTASGGGSIDATGSYSAIKAGEWTVYANSSALSAQAAVTVKPAALKVITLNPADAKITAGESIGFTATGYDVFDNIVTLGSLVWTARLGSNQAKLDDGLFKQRKTGIYDIRATDTATNIYGRALAEITPGELNKLVIDPAEIEVTAGTVLQLSVYGFDKYDNPVDTGEVTLGTDGGGELDHATQTFTAKYSGKWTATAAAKNAPGIKASSSITVIPGAVASITISPAEHNMQAGTSKEFKAVCWDVFGNELVEVVELTWSQSGGGSFTSPGYFLAESAGEWNIYAKYGEIVGVASVTVSPGLLVKMIIAPKAHEMFVNEKITFKVTGYDDYDNEITEPLSLDWSVSGGGSVDNMGLFTAEAVGDFIVTAYSSSAKREATATLHIKPGSDTDSDGDGMPDLWELEHGLNPQLAGDDAADPDGDGATNLEEYSAGTDPNTGDTDGDVLPDGWELLHGLNPLSNAGTDGQKGDPDEDGYTNLAEYNMGTDPMDGNDPLKIDDSKNTGSGDKKTGIGNILPFLIIAIIIIVIVVIIFLRKPKSEKPVGAPEPTFAGVPPLAEPPEPPLLPEHEYYPQEQFYDQYPQNDYETIYKQY